MSLRLSIDVWLARIIKWPVFVSASCIGLMMLLAVTDIVTSKFFSLPIPGTAEIIEEANVFVICMAVAYVQLSRGHISVNVFAKCLSSRTNHALNLAGYILGMLASGLVSWRAVVLTQTMIELSSTKAGLVKFVLWPFPLAIVVGFTLLTLAFLITFVKGIATGPELQPGSDS
jgi:TRAP-type C4-dicarboxylate transport system permease small subunit